MQWQCNCKWAITHLPHKKSGKNEITRNHRMGDHPSCAKWAITLNMNGIFNLQRLLDGA